MKENQKYYSKEEVDRMISEMQKSIKHLKRREFYTKKEVNKIIERTENNIRLNIKEMLETDIESLPNCFRLNPAVIYPKEKEVFRESLYHGLKNEGFLNDETKLDDFKRVFSGKENVNDNFEKIKWKGTAQLAVYLIVKMGVGKSFQKEDRLKIIADWSTDDRKFTKKMLAFFEGMNQSSISSQKRYSLEHIQGLFTIADADKIDSIIENAIKKNKIT